MTSFTRLRNITARTVHANLLPPGLTDPELDLETAKVLFRDYVDQVEIENHDFCNRVCWFCPNVFIDRRSQLRRMSEAVFEKILSDLSQIQWTGTLTWSRYHEAFADPGIIPRIARARAALPRATLMVISNGDYLNRALMTQIAGIGLDRLVLDLYLPQGKEHNEGTIARSLRIFSRRTGATLVAEPDGSYRLANLPFKATLEVVQYEAGELSTRGGLVDLPKRQHYRRRAVCFAPVRHVVLDYNGKAVLCCQSRSDAPSHATAVIGDLNQADYGLFHVYRDLARARRGLLAAGPKHGICATCDVRDDGPSHVGRSETLARWLHRAPGMAWASARSWRAAMRKQF